MKRCFTWVVLGVLPVGAAAAAELDWPRLHERAEQRTWAALAPAERALTQSPDGLYVLGLRALAARRWADAARAFAALSNAAPGTVEAAWGLAEVARREHREAACQPVFESILKQTPAYALARLSLASLRFDAGAFEESLQLAREIVDRGSAACDGATYARALVTVGGIKGVLAQEGGPVAKLRHGPQVFGFLKRAGELRPDDSEVLLALGGFYLFAPRVAGGDSAKGVACVWKALDRDPLSPEAHARMAQVYQLRGDMARYREYIEKARQLDPRSVLVNDVASGRCRYGGRGVKG